MEMSGSVAFLASLGGFQILCPRQRFLKAWFSSRVLQQQVSLCFMVQSLELKLCCSTVEHDRCSLLFGIIMRQDWL